MQTRPTCRRIAVAATDHCRMQALLAIASYMQETRAARAAQPFVAIPCVVGRPNGAKIQRQHARCMRTVHQRVDPHRVQALHQCCDREHDGGRAADMVQHRQACPRGHAIEHRIEDLIGMTDRHLYPGHHHHRPGGMRNEIQQIGTGQIGVIGGEDLIARHEDTRAQHRAQRSGDIGDKSQILGIGADHLAQGLTSLVQQQRKFAQDKRRGLTFHARAQLGLPLQDHDRTGAQHAVIETAHVGIQRKVAPKRAWTAVQTPGCLLHEELQVTRSSGRRVDTVGGAVPVDEL